jgi:hypothetical protein
VLEDNLGQRDASQSGTADLARHRSGYVSRRLCCSATRPEWQGIGTQLGGVRLVSPLGESTILKLPRGSGIAARARLDRRGGGRLVPVVDMHRYFGTA